MNRWTMLAAVLALGACTPKKAAPPEPEVPSIAPTRPASAWSDRFCAMPVRDGRPTKADVDAAYRMVGEVRLIPGSDEPWIRPYNRGGEWTINAEGRYVPYPGPTPNALFDLEMVHEPSPDRVVGMRGDVVLARAAGAGAFAPIAKLGDQTLPGGPVIRRIADADLTLVLRKGQIHQVRGDAVAPWPEQESLKAAGVSGVIDIHDLPGLGAALFEGQDGALAVRYTDGAWRKAGRLRPERWRPDDRIVDVRPVPKAGVALISTYTDHLVLVLSPDAASSRRAAIVDVTGIHDEEQDPGGWWTVASPTTGDVIRFGRVRPSAPLGWQRLVDQRFVPMDAPAWPASNPLARAYDLTGGEGLVIRGDDGLALYRRGALTPIPQSSKAELGRHPEVVRLASLDRTYVISDRGLFELTAAGRLRKVDARFVTGGSLDLDIFELPQQRLALVRAKDGLFTLDADGEVLRVRGGEGFAPANLPKLFGPFPVSGDVLITDHNTLKLVVTPRSPRWKTCNAALAATAGRT
ncbi:hypothetical protein CFHF_03280 [Caulobacter flavus]|uniref:WG repeat-containing protein n=1 Tax=Caulobacter flavus TaxID=1679497 RepID=A0A2N5CZ69_9CAUL|nr:hypothetical protein [Caulobacter flavus]AYV45273.1 hypothetical protein C1707_02890 [Caulobacter flavus]PLR19046.1 hypothetical protein CFHF_03280 [Caulobacter flavus]